MSAPETFSSDCPAGATENHLWYRTGGVTRAALDRFDWPSEDEVEP